MAKFDNSSTTDFSLILKKIYVLLYFDNEREQFNIKRTVGEQLTE